MRSNIIDEIKKLIDDSEFLFEPGDVIEFGLPRAARQPVLSAIHHSTNSPIILAADRSDNALALLDELGFWLPDENLLFFPEPNPLFYENIEWGVTTRRDRLRVLSLMASYHIPPKTIENHPIIVTSVRAIMTRTLPLRAFLTSCQLLKIEREFNQQQLIRNWLHIGYESSTIVVSPGQFSRRGGLLDIWVPGERFPHRVEFFGDIVDTITLFDPTTQRTMREKSHTKVDKIWITPAREFIIPKSKIEDSHHDYNESHIPLLHQTSANLLDFLPSSSHVLVENKHLFWETIRDIEEQAVSIRKDLLERKEIQDDHPLPFTTQDHIQDNLNDVFTGYLGPQSGANENILAIKFQPNPRFGGKLKTVIDYMGSLAKDGKTTFVVSRQSSRIQELWRKNYTELSEVSKLVQFQSGSLGDGWNLETFSGSQIVLLTDGEIFGWRRPQPRQRHQAVVETPDSAYTDLNEGSFVVHLDHGIGRYSGLVQRSIEGFDGEYLAIEYAKGDLLFVPVHQSDRIAPYVGQDMKIPDLSTLGATSWGLTKSRVRKEVASVAKGLLELYAKRSVVKGYSYQKDTEWQFDLEASFPYIETQDQITVIEEVKRDMESDKPMDRLICGDVGYGKTEIALRAAFKAVMDGKQVSLLVPTTILAQQHYHTFKQRLMPFPINVEMLSRFRTPSQQRAILDKQLLGEIDIIIGTHRLLSQDVEFSDLGLLIIDEEQRFGVTHKEKLKQMRTEVDVLTMTATPIPRTLYLTLTGLRDISSLETPPEDRLPITTHVGPYDERTVRDAVIREIERGGQVFFVHNRVRSIEIIKKQLQMLIPGIEIGIAHGQMSEKELSVQMERFTSGEIDMLLSTSIIESGLDIPNANTLIVDRADTFGLAQLYQLRGRVGRGAQRAYAYFFMHAQRAPTKEGLLRLETISENTRLGAGYSISMRDLEIRGPGDILGAKQHGYISAVGFHLYTRLLSDAVRSIRRESTAQHIPKPELSLRPLTKVELHIDASIPSTYIHETDMRLILYRRLSDVLNNDQLGELREEFEDRFGTLPIETENLFTLTNIKLLGESIQIQSIQRDGQTSVLRFAENFKLPSIPKNIAGLRKGKQSIWIDHRNSELPWIEHLETTMKALVSRKI